MKILVLGVIYSGVEKYLNDYFNSLDQQTYTDFDILIIEDGLHLPNKFYRNSLITKENKEECTPADIRFFAIEFAKKKNYDALIFTDCDDYFSQNRFEKTVQALKCVDFCVNKLIPIDESGKIIEEINDLNIPNNLSINEILNANYFGMSNTSINLHSLPKDFYIPSDLIAVDWWLYSIFLLHNKKYLYDEEVITYYRQYDKNIVGISSILDKYKLIKGIDVKLLHFINLLDYCKRNNSSGYIAIINNIIEDFNQLKIKLHDENFLKNYMEIINDNFDKIKTGWWSEILSLKEWRKYG